MVIALRRTSAIDLKNLELELIVSSVNRIQPVNFENAFAGSLNPM